MKTVFFETDQYKLDSFKDITQDSFDQLSGSVLFVESEKQVYYMERKKRGGAAILIMLPGIVIADYIIQGMKELAKKKIIEEADSKLGVNDKLPLRVVN